MSKYRQLKSIAHNYTDSFLSLENYTSDCHEQCIKKLIITMYAHHLNEVRFNIFNMQPDPDFEYDMQLRIFFSQYKTFLPWLLKKHGLTNRYINQASMRFAVEFPDASLLDGIKGCVTVPFTCSTTLIDDKNRSHEALLHQSSRIAKRFLLR